MRDLIRLRSILFDLARVIQMNPELPVTHSKMFKDNNFALECSNLLNIGQELSILQSNITILGTT